MSSRPASAVLFVHFLCNEPGWEEVAGAVIDWAGQLNLDRSETRPETKV